MATLTVVRFPTAHGADHMIRTLSRLQKQRLISIRDAAIVNWPAGKRAPQTHQLHSLAGVGALHGSFWGLLFGLLFFAPVLGLTIGAATGALVGSMANVGIDHKFIAEVRGKVTEGTSALFLLTSDAVIDRLTVELKGQSFDVIATNLSKENEDYLRNTFAA